MCAPLSPFELNLVHGNRQNRSKCHRKLPKGPFAQISDKKRPSTESSWIVFNLFQKQKNCLSISQNGAYTLRNVPTKKKKTKGHPVYTSSRTTFLHKIAQTDDHDLFVISRSR
jgi:hypothetical protein